MAKLACRRIDIYKITKTRKTSSLKNPVESGIGGRSQKKKTPANIYDLEINGEKGRHHLFDQQRVLRTLHGKAEGKQTKNSFS